MEQVSMNIMKNQYNMWNNSSWNPQKARERYNRDKQMREWHDRSKKLYHQVFNPVRAKRQSVEVQLSMRNQDQNIYGDNTISTRQDTERNNTIDYSGGNGRIQMNQHQIQQYRSASTIEHTELP